MSKPASPAMAWMTSATCRLSGLFGTMKSTRDGRRHAGVGKQLLGLGHIAPRHRELAAGSRDSWG